MRQIPAARPRRQISNSQRLAWLRLIRSENVGPVTFRDLLNRFGGAEAALEALPELSCRGGRGRAVRVCSASEAERELAAAEVAGARLTAVDEPGYPLLLAVTEAPPPLLYVSGRTELADRTVFGIVGARDASAAGRTVAMQIAESLGRHGVAVASGLARGIDTAAHEGAIATGTIAVVAGGIDVTYPPENAALQARIAREGLLVSECAPGLAPRGKDFPRRNRIISGMSVGVLVVEAALRSGSRITADYAREQGRGVFAVPGNPLDPRAAGTNQLLKTGATLVTQAADILAAIGNNGQAATLASGAFEAEAVDASVEPSSLAQSARQTVIEALGPAPVRLDDLVRVTHVLVRDVRTVLLELDLAGRLERSAGERVALKS